MEHNLKSFRKYCAKCHKIFDGDSNFCDVCGIPLIFQETDCMFGQNTIKITTLNGRATILYGVERDSEIFLDEGENIINVVEYPGLSSGFLFDNEEDIIKIDLSHFDSSKLEDMRELFADCVNLVNINLHGIKTTHISDMSGLFSLCESLSILDFTNIDTSNVVDMCDMFHGCKSIKRLFLDNFNTHNVNDMGWMFHGCDSLTSLHINNFNILPTTRTDNMFQYCKSMRCIFAANCDEYTIARIKDELYKANVIQNVEIDTGGF